MRLTWLAVLIFSAAAFGQSPSDAHCTPLKNLHETACSFGDGTGEVISSTSISHFTAEQWDKAYYALIKADDDAEAKSVHEIDEAKAQELSAEKARAALEKKAHSVHRKKECVAASFKWAYGACWLKDEVSPEAR